MVETNEPVEEDVSNADLKKMLEKYFKGDMEILPTIGEAILKRKLSGKHEETDDELMEEFRHQPMGDVKDAEFESDFEKLHETDEELDDLYYAKQHAVKKITSQKYFNMDDKRWDEIVREGVERGVVQDTRECQEILEDMLHWDKLLPDETKKKVEEKFNEIGDLVESGVHTPEEGYELFKAFEDQIVLETLKEEEGKEPPQFDDGLGKSDEPPGEGPILRWQSRVVFSPGNEQWHPKNRLVKMGVTVKELGLSKYQFRRLRALVGKRYDPGKDELMITSERFEHREENRKDCFRTLLSIIEEAGKADEMVEAARTSYVKQKLQANPRFMERLSAKTKSLRADTAFMERRRSAKLEGSKPAESLAP